MEKLKLFLTEFKTSVKSVLLNFKEFTAIYIAIIVVQLLLGVWTMSAYTNTLSNDALFKDAYGYDVYITDAKTPMNDLYGICKANGALVADCGMVDGKIGVSVQNGKLDEFQAKVLSRNQAEYYVTPYYNYHYSVRGETILTMILMGIVIFGIATLIISVIHSIRTNHYKFRYGIYVTFGADRKTLASFASRELFTICTITLFPSFIISYILNLTVYLDVGIQPIIRTEAVLLYVILSYVTVAIAAGGSMGSFLFSSPVSLISTSDNSNFVTSPRRSFYIFSKKIPLHYELYSVWRFRKYIVRLISGAVAFSVIFVTMIYWANMVKAENEAPKEEYSVKFAGGAYSEDERERALDEAVEIIDHFNSLDSVDSIVFEQSRNMNVFYDHLLIKNENNLSGNDYSVNSTQKRSEGYTRATNYSRYVCLDEMTLKNYEKNYDVEYLDGLNSSNLTESDQYVVLSEGMYGVKSFDFAPGDKILIAEKISSVPIPGTADRLESLRQQLYNFGFEYREYTVGAVIHDKDATDSIIVGVNENNYSLLTKDKRAISNISVYLKNGTDLETVGRLKNSTEQFMSGYDLWECKYTDEAVYSFVDYRNQLPRLITVLSFLILVICPVIWIFSQVMFFKKRETEFRTLGYIGIGMKKILGIHLVSGVLIFIIGFILNYAFSRIACYILYRLMSVYLPKLSIGGLSVSFESFVPSWVIVVCAAVSAFCGMISGIIPFILYERKIKKEGQSIKNIDINSEG